MSVKIPAGAKKDFIRLVLKEGHFKREVNWIFNYILSNDKLIENVVFVNESIQETDRGIYAADLRAETESFRYYKNTISTADAEKAFHDIRLNREEKLYVQLKLTSIMQAKFYEVLEDNPHHKVSTREKRKMELTVNDLERQNQKRLIDYYVNKALDEQNEEAFMEWTAKYADLPKAE